MSFSDFEYAGKRKQTRRERFLAEMKQVVPWSELVALIEPHYPKAGGGRKPYPLETMLRIHLLQNWFSLSNPAMEEALYEITSMRQFARLTLSAPIPEDTTIMNFRHLLEKHQLAAGILEPMELSNYCEGFTGCSVLPWMGPQKAAWLIGQNTRLDQPSAAALLAHTSMLMS